MFSLYYCGFIDVASSIESCMLPRLLELARVSKAPSVAALKGFGFDKTRIHDDGVRVPSASSVLGS